MLNKTNALKKELLGITQFTIFIMNLKNKNVQRILFSERRYKYFW